MSARVANLSVNGFYLVSGAPARFDLLTLEPTSAYGVVIRTGSGAVKIRQADGTERELCQSIISRITQDLTDAELILWECGYLI